MSLIVLVVLLLQGRPLFAQSAVALEPASGVAAVVGDVPIRDEEVDRRWRESDPATYQRLRRETFEGRRRALDALLTERLLAGAAMARGVSVETLMDEEVTRRVRPVTDADVAAFVAQNPLPVGTTAEVVAPMVAALLGQRAREQARDEFIASLLAEPSRARVLLEAPRVETLREAYNPTRGPANAPVQVTVFSDFECPFCRRAEPALTQLIARFPEEVMLVWKHYPLSIHAGARPAAEAAQCAHDQGRFWPFHDALFAETLPASQAAFADLARRLGLDVGLFADCLVRHAHAREVERDVAAGERAGVAGTPTVFINGLAFTGSLPVATYEKAVLDELRRLRPTAPAAVSQTTETMPLVKEMSR
jgi:protein-disulfide isomerase